MLKVGKKPLIGQIYNLYLKSKEKEIFFTLKGKSMYPALKDSWKVKIKSSYANEINYGDIVVFAQNELICHRIIGKFKWNRKLYFIHCGDSVYIGRVFEEKNLIGKVVEVSDAAGNIVDEQIWRRSFNSLLKFSLLGYLYLPLFITKRILFGKTQTKFTRWTSRVCWHFLQYLVR